MRKRTGRVASAMLVIAGALVLAGCSGLSSSGAPSPPAAAPPRAPAGWTVHTALVEGTGAAAPFDEAELFDYRTVAKELGKPLEDVLASQRGSKELRTLASGLELDRASGYVCAGHDTERPGTAWIAFSTRPTAATFARIRDLPLDTTVTWGVPLDSRGLGEYTGAVMQALDGIDGVQPVSAGPSSIGDSVEVTYALRSGATAPTRATLDAAVLRATRAWSIGGRLLLPVRFTLGSTGEFAGGAPTAPTLEP